MSLLDLVDPLIGADSHHGFSTGNCPPLCALPFGMNTWSPQSAEGSWFFDRNHRKLQGIRLTHQPSPWIGDYGALVLMPQTGDLVAEPEKRSSAYRLDHSTVKPHLLRFWLSRYETEVQLAPTKRAAHLKIKFPPGVAGRLLIQPQKGDAQFELCDDRQTACGFTRSNSGGCPDNFACYYVIAFSRPVTACGALDGNLPRPDLSSLSGERAGGYVEFGPDPGELEVTVAASFISIHQARVNSAREIGTASFEETAERAKRSWEDTLGRVKVSDSDLEAKKTFYTCLYRCHLFPRLWDEEDGQGAVVHYSPYTGETHEGSLTVDNGFWDTYRTVYPLLSLLMPEKLAQFLEGWVNAYKEGGWFPQWASPGYRACMVGTHIDAVMADAASRGIVAFDRKAALEGMLKHADQVGDAEGSYGRIGIEDYNSLGFVPSDRHHAAVSRTLDYAFDDYCIAKFAQSQGHPEVAERLLKRAQSYRNLWDAETGLMRPKRSDGAFAEPFDQLEWGGAYVEGGPWQSSWGVSHDVAGLIELVGGSDRLVQRLTELLTMRPDFRVGDYGFEIHEMTEMALANFGQYAHSNQPVHHILYLFAAAGQPWHTQHWVRRVMDELYTASSFPGDEDNGEMSAWYVLSALGLYPLTPGSGSWVYGAPRFERVELRGDSGATLTVEAHRASPQDQYVGRILVDGIVEEALWIEHSRLRDGTTLRFEMQPQPHTYKRTDPLLLPPSLSG